MEHRELPLVGQLYACADFKNYADERSLTTDLDNANVITSVVANSNGLIHKPVIDIDLPISVLPSSTPGHHHLFIDHVMTWDQYVMLLGALVAAGLVEQGYFDASLTRGHTAVRLPWVRK